MAKADKLAVDITINSNERSAGGEWDSGRKLRIIRYEKVTELGPEDRCVGVINQLMNQDSIIAGSISI